MRFWVGICIGATLAALAIETAMQFLPVNSGMRLANTDDAMPFSRRLPGQRFVYSHGWSLLNARSGAVNNQGFGNSPDFGDSADIIVIGDSYIEGFMLSYPETIQGLLNNALGGGVVAAAASGNGLADSLSIAKFYAPKLHPTTLVLFIEPSDLSLLNAPPLRGHSAFVDGAGGVQLVHQPYKELASKELVRRSALARYLRYNLKATELISAPRRKGESSAESMSGKLLRESYLRYYFSELQSLASSCHLTVIFLMDGDRGALYSKNTAVRSVWDQDDKQVFMNLAAEYRHEVIDMQPVFAGHWANSHERMDYLPADGHWNPVAHRLAAAEVLKRRKLIANTPGVTP